MVVALAFRNANWFESEEVKKIYREDEYWCWLWKFSWFEFRYVGDL